MWTRARGSLRLQQTSCTAQQETGPLATLLAAQTPQCHAGAGVPLPLQGLRVVRLAGLLPVHVQSRRVRGRLAHLLEAARRGHECGQHRFGQDYCGIGARCLLEGIQNFGSLLCCPAHARSGRWRSSRRRGGRALLVVPAAYQCLLDSFAAQSRRSSQWSSRGQLGRACGWDHWLRCEYARAWFAQGCRCSCCRCGQAPLPSFSWLPCPRLRAETVPMLLLSLATGAGGQFHPHSPRVPRLEHPRAVADTAALHGRARHDRMSNVPVCAVCAHCTDQR